MASRLIGDCTESCTAGRRLSASASALFFPVVYLMLKLKVDKTANHQTVHRVLTN
jgi:hypothetical protein